MPGRVLHPGDLAGVASRLSDAGIDINYGYGGIEPHTNVTFLIFRVAEADQAVKIFEQAGLARLLLKLIDALL